MWGTALTSSNTILPPGLSTLNVSRRRDAFPRSGRRFTTQLDKIQSMVSDLIGKASVKAHCTKAT